MMASAMEKNERGKGHKEYNEWVGFSRMIKEGLTEKLTCKQRPGGGEGGRHTVSGRVSSSLKGRRAMAQEEETEQRP